MTNKEALFEIMKKENNSKVDIIWAENEKQALNGYIERIERIYGRCAYSKNELYAKIV